MGRKGRRGAEKKKAVAVQTGFISKKKNPKKRSVAHTGFPKLKPPAVHYK
jgi:hypothetical protein